MRTSTSTFGMAPEADKDLQQGSEDGKCVIHIYVCMVAINITL